MQTVAALELQGQGFDAFVGPPGNRKLADTLCVQCGQCALVCPTAAITERDDTPLGMGSAGGSPKARCGPDRPSDARRHR
ncbi:4Fe-4S binding protein [Thermodesulfitimonas sp.]